MLRRGAPAMALGVFGLVLAVHLVAQLAGADALARATQALLMPALAAALALGARGRHSRLTRLALLGLGCSWLGDVLPGVVGGDAAFLVLIGAFAVAQTCYALAFWPWRRRSLARTPWAFAYLGYAAALVLLVAPGAGPLLPVVVVYAALITLMALLATGVHPLAGLGAAVFVLSDSLIALETFVPWWRLPGQGFWVMATYGLAQLLIVLGVLRARAPASDPPGRALTPPAAP